jgi:hypothetical protein
MLGFGIGGFYQKPWILKAAQGRFLTRNPGNRMKGLCSKIMRLFSAFIGVFGQFFSYPTPG